MSNQFDWMQETLYEPPAINYAPRRALTLRMFAWICALAVIGGALWGMSHG